MALKNASSGVSPAPEADPKFSRLKLKCASVDLENH
tara:strand:- start:37 stop:144 length:108 start_codon:yes stop_codon:yes gene_type:complete